MRLITIRLSHFNERARWALDRFRVPYAEQAYMPLLHVPPVLLATRGRGGRVDRHSTRYSTPVLVLDDGRCLCDSGEIVRWVDEQFSTPETTLYPEAQRGQIEVMERELEERLGGATRRVAYFMLLRQPGLLSALAERNVGSAQARLFRLIAPAGRRYLFGERFSAADLTLASLLAPVFLPSASEGYGASLPRLDELDEEAAALVHGFRQHPVGEYCLRLFATERQPARGETLGVQAAS
jgi:glutathione S-transferase